MTSKRALITGVCGQDGSTLARMLLEDNYDVYGVYRRVSSGNNFSNIADFREHKRLHLISGDICDYSFMGDLIKNLQPDEFYNLAAMSHVAESFKLPTETFRIDAEAVLFQLDTLVKTSKNTRYYNAASSEIFGGLNCPETGFDENSLINPRSPYAIAKAAAYHSTNHFRTAYELHASSGILFNHSGPARGGDFATRRITRGVAEVKLGLAAHVPMGNLAPYRDEGHSVDYMRAARLILSQPEGDNYIVATGQGATIEQMFRHVCGLADLKFEDVYRQDEKYMRPSDVPFLRGNATKIRTLGWEPAYTWQTILEQMYQNDLNQLKERAG
jgi:GDPmannose 4,6-dehydratase